LHHKKPLKPYKIQLSKSHSPHPTKTPSQSFVLRLIHIGFVVIILIKLQIFLMQMLIQDKMKMVLIYQELKFRGDVLDRIALSLSPPNAGLPQVTKNSNARCRSVFIRCLMRSNLQSSSMLRPGMYHRHVQLYHHHV